MTGTQSLIPVDTGIWIAEGPVVDFFALPYSTRMVVIRLQDGTLWVWSPIALTDGLRAEVAGMGPVRTLISPNRLHHLSLSEWHDAFPDAAIWGPVSTARKRPDIRFTGILSDDRTVPWAAEIDHVHVRGCVVFDEVVFFHRSSSTAILGDLSENFSEAFIDAHWSWWQRLLARRWGITKGLAPLEMRLGFLDRATARAAVGRILAWNPQRVIMAHGAWQDSDGRTYLERCFAWLGPLEAIPIPFLNAR